MSHADTLREWISPEYVTAFDRGTLQDDFTQSDPFRYSVLPAFFIPEAFSRIRSAVDHSPTERAHEKGLAANSNWFWGAFNDLDAVKFLYGKAFRAFLNQLLGLNLAFKSSSYPQVNVFHPGSKGIPVHTDDSELNVAAVTLFQMSRGCGTDKGGELNLFRKTPTGFECVESVIPHENTFVAFNVSKHSYHSVSDLKGDWTRQNVTIDWYLREQA